MEVFYLTSMTYNNNDKRVAYVLSFMTKGTAKTWKEAFITDTNSAGVLTLGAYNALNTTLLKVFATGDTKGEARSKLC